MYVRDADQVSSEQDVEQTCFQQQSVYQIQANSRRLIRQVNQEMKTISDLLSQ